jgi:MSHA biogenesis protein MshQ
MIASASLLRLICCTLLLYCGLAGAADYTLPAALGTAPFANCTFSSGSTYNCAGNIALSNNVLINISSPLTLNISGNFSANNQLDIFSNGNAFTMNIGGNFSANNQATINTATINAGGNISLNNSPTLIANLISGGNVSLGNNTIVTGSIDANGNVSSGNNTTITGNVDAGGNLSIGSGSITGNCTYITTNTNCSSPPSLSINNAALTEGNSGSSNLSFTVSASGTSVSAITVNYATANGTASGGASCFGGIDYLSQSGTLSIPAGSTSGTIVVPVCGDTLYETNETFTVSLSSPSFANLGTPNVGTGTINNDDSAPSLSINNNSSAEGNSSTTPFTFTVSLSSASGVTTSVLYATADGTATGGTACTSGIDYLSQSGTLSIPALSTSGSIGIQVCGDTVFEPDETFTLTLSSPTNATLGSPSVGTATIINDDAAPVGGLNAVDSGANVVSGKIATKIVGSAFNLDVAVLNSGKTAADSSINGQTILVELMANVNSGTSLGSDNCPTGSSAIIAVGTYTLSAGKASATVSAIASAYRDVRVRLRYPATGTVIASGCSTDNFALRPNAFGIAVQDANWAQAYTSGTPRNLNNTALSGGVVHKAGQPFTLSATANNAGNSAVVANYDGSASLVLAACASTDVCPAVGALGTLSASSLDFTGGTASNSSLSYSEVGAFSLQLQDSTYASVDNGDGTAADCSGSWICSGASDVGRFVPDHYDVTASQTPILQTFGATSCSNRSFSYLGQHIGFATLPKALITAKNAGGNSTINYRNALWKLDAPSHLATTWSCLKSTGSACPTATVGAPALSSGDLLSSGNGSGYFSWPTNGSYPSGVSYQLTRGSPVAPFFAQIALSLGISDSSENGNCGTSPCTIVDSQGGNPTWGNNLAFDAGNQFRHGRLKVGNAYGATNLDLAIVLETQYYNASGSFVTNSVDQCTQLSGSSIGLRNPQRELSLAEISGHASLASGNFVSGQKRLRLARPSGGNGRYDGTIDVFVFLDNDAVCSTAGASSANLGYLQDSWGWDGSLCQNPVGRASFGLERQKFLFMREQF